MCPKIWVHDSRLVSCVYSRSRFGQGQHHIPGAIHRVIGYTEVNCCDMQITWFAFLHYQLTWSCYNLKGIVSNIDLCYCSSSPSRLSDLLFACLCASCHFRQDWECGAAVPEVETPPPPTTICSQPSTDKTQLHPASCSFLGQTMTEHVDCLHDKY